jgi:hypothetical protein
MWLKDFLPGDVNGIRIMSYGYNCSHDDETIGIDFLDHRKNLLETLANARPSTLVCMLLDPAVTYPSIFAQLPNEIKRSGR